MPVQNSVFLFLFVTINALASFIIFSPVVVKGIYNSPGRKMLFWSSFSLGPAFSSFALYYLLLIFPNQSVIFYPLAIAFLLVVYAVIFRKSLAESIVFLKNEIQIFTTKLKKIPATTKDSIPLFFFLIGLLAVFFFWIFILLNKPILGNDMLEYASQAKIFFRDRHIYYQAMRFDVSSGYYYGALHGLLFPLVGTLEQMVNSLFGISSDLYFKSISGYYSFLLILVFYFFLKRITNSTNAVVASVILLFTFSFFLGFYNFHIDSFRLTFLFTSLIFAYYTLLQRENYFFFAFVLFGSCEANAHSIGAILFPIQMALVFVLWNVSWNQKVKSLAVSLPIIVLVGYPHYLLEVITGNGWIFGKV